MDKELISSKLKIADISEDEWIRIDRDIKFIGLVDKIASGMGMRVIVTGGYAADGSLGQVTRSHRDIDIQVFGKSGDAMGVIQEIINEVASEDSEFEHLKIKEDKGRKVHYHSIFAEMPDLGADFNYIQVVGDPLSDERTIVKKDGSHTDSQKYETVKVVLNGVEYEAEDPEVGLADILYKRERGDTPKSGHDQDICNLKLITDEGKVNKKLEQQKQRI